MGPIKPTPEDFKRTPLLVCKHKVKEALEWLTINHRDYYDLDISYRNLEDYPDEGSPVVVQYKYIDSKEGNIIPLTTSMYETEIEEGTESGPCPFTVHGLTSTEYEQMTMNVLKLKALQHLEMGGSALGIGHGESPVSMYDNPSIYPSMFPWLFPYGMGGIGQKCHKSKFPEKEHKKWLLMYHDKRFQTDLYFPIIAFNHEQIKGSTTGSFLLAKRKNFLSIAERLVNINPKVLQNLSY